MGRHVTRTWPAQPSGTGSHADRRSFAYDAFVPERLVDVPLDLSTETAEAVIAAERALTELQVGADFLGLESVSRQLLRAESVASSRIEGLGLSQRRLAEAIWDPASADRTAQAVLENIDAMERAIEIGTAASVIQVEHFSQIHAALFAQSGESPPGRIRTSQNWIGGAANSPRGAEFVPPPEEMVPPLLQDLATFMSRDDVAPVVQAAVAHAQFETIHPFSDGNGRVGRALIHVVFKRREAATRFVPPISIVLAANAGRYIEGLTAFRAGRPMEWVQSFARVVTSAVAESRRLAQDLGALHAEWYSRAHRPRNGSAAARLLRLLPSRPIVNAAAVRDQLAVSAVAARNALNALEAAGILAPIVIGKKRNRAWQATEVIALLDDFEWSMAEPTHVGQMRPPSPRPRR